MKYGHILFALAMIGLGVGIVRPQAEKLIGEAWKPVLDQVHSVPVKPEQTLPIDEAGSYVIFLQGPASSPAWDSNDVWVQLLDRRGKDVLPSQAVDYEYDVDGRRGVGIVKVRAISPGDFEVSYSCTDAKALENGGFEFGIVNADLVKDQSWKATQTFIGAIAVAALLAVFALVSVTQRTS